MAGVVTDDLANPIHFAKVNLVDYEQELLTRDCFLQQCYASALICMAILAVIKARKGSQK